MIQQPLFHRLLLLFFLFLQAKTTLAQRDEDDFEFMEVIEPDDPHIPRFRIDYTIRPLLMNNVKELVVNDPNADYDWFRKQPGHQFSFSILPGYRENWTIGVSAYFQHVVRENDEYFNVPTDQSGYAGFTTEYRRKVGVYGNSVLVERRLYSSPMEGFRIFARAEAGFLRYKAKAVIGKNVEQDSTTSFETYQKVRERSTVFSGSLGIGAQYQYKWIGASLVCGYQLQTAHSFLPRNQFNAWKYQFYPENYFGEPQDEQFRIITDDIPDNKVRFGQLYLQISVLFFIGEKWI